MDCSGRHREVAAWSVRAMCSSRWLDSAVFISCWACFFLAWLDAKSSMVRLHWRPHMVELWYWILVVTIAVFVILDGWDIGAGAMHLIVARNDSERRAV